MVDSIKKMLRKMKLSDRDRIDLVIEKIINHDTKDLDIKKLKGKDRLFRVGVGDYRIIYF